MEEALGADIDYAMLINTFGQLPDADRRYSRSESVGPNIRVSLGNPDPKCVSTSYSERQNLIMRMSLRRLTRLTYDFSTKVEDLILAFALHFLYYYFRRVRLTLQPQNLAVPAPSMTASVADHVSSIHLIVRCLEAREAAGSSRLTTESAEWTRSQT